MPSFRHSEVGLDMCRCGGEDVGCVSTPLETGLENMYQHGVAMDSIYMRPAVASAFLVCQLGRWAGHSGK